MSARQVNRFSSVALISLCLIASVTVLVGMTQPPRPLPHDEGALARVFQLALVAQVPLALLFLATADWRRPLRSLRPLAFAFAVSVSALVTII